MGLRRITLTKFEYEQIRDGIQGVIDASYRLTSGNVAHKRGMLRDFLLEARQCLDAAEKRARRAKPQREG